MQHGESKGLRWSSYRFAIGALTVSAALLLVLEHRAHLLGTAPLLLVLLICFGAHFFMHGGHGKRGNTGRGGERRGGGDGI